jgi:hypothetical protein
LTAGFVPLDVTVTPLGTLALMYSVARLRLSQSAVGLVLAVQVAASVLMLMQINTAGSSHPARPEIPRLDSACKAATVLAMSASIR